MPPLKQTLKYRAAIFRERHLQPFVFIHINKTGGSSVEKALGARFEHKTAQEKITMLGRNAWDRKFTFCIVRNPWDRAVSLFHYRKMTDQTGLADTEMGFQTWLRQTLQDQDPAFYDKPRMFMPQRDWIADDNGQILVDYTMRFENLHRSFEEVARRLGKDVRLPHLKKSKRRDYRTYYDAATIDLVAEFYAVDLEAFGYTFDGVSEASISNA
ncbi:MAG: sulfotransferase family 2 domain-containing protein [Bacteroidota bacterium]